MSRPAAKRIAVSMKYCLNERVFVSTAGIRQTRYRPLYAKGIITLKE